MTEVKTQPTKQQKKKDLLIILASVILFLLLAIGSIVFFTPSPNVRPANHTTTSKLTVTCDDCAAAGTEINIWQSAGMERGYVMFTVPHGTVVEIVDNKNADDGRVWYQVKYKNRSGWLPSDFLR